MLVSVYSITGTVTSKFIASNIDKTLNGQKEYLGGNAANEKICFYNVFFSTSRDTVSGGSVRWSTICLQCTIHPKWILHL